MKKKATMRQAVLWSTLLMTGLMLVAYTLLLFQYFGAGMDSVIRSEMLYVLSLHEDYLQANIDASESFDIKPDSYQVYLNLPEAWKKRFSDQKLENDEVVYFEEQVSEENIYQIYILFPYLLPDGRKVYATQIFKSNETIEQKWKEEDVLLLIIPVAFFFLLLILFVVIRLGRRLSQPVNGLAQWADRLTLENYHEVRPDFAFRELNQVADHLQGAFNRIGEFLERERNFLRHASHELRTPVAVINANVELIQKGEIDPVMELSVGRIGRSGKNMHQLIETLLWISREEARKIVYEEVDISDLLVECTEELSYLLKRKPVTFALQCVDEPVILNLPRVPFRILCNNLLHNAFKHTTEGQIIIRLTACELEICNQDVALAEQSDLFDNSFGIGFELVHLLAKKMQWKVLLCPEASGYKATLVFPAQTEETE